MTIERNLAALPLGSPLHLPLPPVLAEETAPAARRRRGRSPRSLRGRDWQGRYRRVVHVVDATVIGLVSVVAVLVAGREATPWSLVAGVGTAVLWYTALRAHRSSSPAILGHGAQEYTRVSRATFTAFGSVAIAVGLLRIDVAWYFLAFSLPLGTAGLLAGRKVLRLWLASARRRGALTSDVLVVGSARSAAALDRHLARHPEAGLRVAGVWVADAALPTRGELGTVRGATVPVLDDAAELADALAASGADTVVVTNSEHLGDHGVRELAWELQAAGGTLLVSPHVTDVAAPRLDLQLVGGMPLLHVEKPTFEGATRVAKRAFDLVFAAAALVALAPVMLGIATAVRLTSAGPVIYRSERIGTGGVPFEMLKFRTMVQDADQVKAQLTSDTGGVLFKMKDDPRITGIGAVLRRFSLDELPQLLNVVRGEMSIVGPRPPLQAEVEQYDENVGRRLLVKQGLTGLWQVSGRSNLSWEDTVRLDLDYVENWSMRRDLAIIWATFRAVVGRDGAY